MYTQPSQHTSFLLLFCLVYTGASNNNYYKEIKTTKKYHTVEINVCVYSFENSNNHKNPTQFVVDEREDYCYGL